MARFKINQLLKPLTVAAAVFGAASGAQAGSIFMTGHDILLHSGQNGYDAVILDYLRGAGTSGEIAQSSYTISVVGSGVGFARFTGQSSSFTGGAPATGNTISATGTLAGYGTATYYQTGTGADWNTILAADALVILSHTNCGGCDLSTAGSAEVNSNAAAIAAAFNGGMDIWANSGANLGTYYDFLPPDVVASGAPIGGSSGFSATTEGLAIGISDVSPSMINGFPTHNRFFDQASAFDVLEVRGTEIISIGVQDAQIDDGGGLVTVPEPASIAFLGFSAIGFAFARRRKRA